MFERSAQNLMLWGLALVTLGRVLKAPALSLMENSPGTVSATAGSVVLLGTAAGLVILAAGLMWAGFEFMVQNDKDAP